MRLGLVQPIICVAMLAGHSQSATDEARSIPLKEWMQIGRKNRSFAEATIESKRLEDG
jgi:hypothetical protein